MQIVSCHVAIGGDLNNVRVFEKIDEITVPEVLVLRHVHGFDAVTEIEVVGNIKRSNADEVERLRARYDWNRTGEDAKPVIPQIYPGARPNLPQTLKEISPEIEEADGTVEVLIEEEAPPAAAHDGDLGDLFGAPSQEEEVASRGKRRKGPAPIEALE